MRSSPFLENYRICPSKSVVNLRHSWGQSAKCSMRYISASTSAICPVPSALLRMQFQVPQFIEIEDKIFGPLTFKQFIYVAGGAGACYLLWRVLPLLLPPPFFFGGGGVFPAVAVLK